MKTNYLTSLQSEWTKSSISEYFLASTLSTLTPAPFYICSEKHSTAISNYKLLQWQILSMIHWLSSFAIPGRTISLKRMTLIDVLKLSFSAVVLVWTNIVYMVQKKKEIWISKAVPKQETFWTKVFKYLYSREMIACCLFPMNSSKSNIYTHLQWSPREAVLVPEPLHWNCLLQKEKKLQHLCLKTNKILFTWYNFPHG